jgi:hypothetical protein
MTIWRDTAMDVDVNGVLDSRRSAMPPPDFRQHVIDQIQHQILVGRQAIGEIHHPLPDFTPSTPVQRADAAIKEKWNSSFGDPVIPGEVGVIGSGDRYFRDYASATIYTDLSHGPDTFVLWGANRDRYLELGGPGSWLGWPTSSEQDFVENGKVNTFEHGAIYWWPDTGPIDLGNVSVRYRGIYCFSESDWDQGSPDDEQQVILGMVPAVPNMQSTFKSQVYTDVDSGDARPDNVEIYRGLPYGLAISTTLLEIDFGGSDVYLDKVKDGVQAAGHTAAGIAAAFPPGGPVVALVLEALLKEFGDDVAVAVNGLLDFGDDVINTVPLFLSGKDMVTMCRAPRENFWGIEWQRDTPLIVGQGVNTKAYFDVIGV